MGFACHTSDVNRANAKPPFGLRSERASWMILLLVLAYPIWAIVLMNIDPHTVSLWPFMAALFVVSLVCPVYSILWFRRRRQGGDGSGT